MTELQVGDRVNYVKDSIIRRNGRVVRKYCTKSHETYGVIIRWENWIQDLAYQCPTEDIQKE